MDDATRKVTLTLSPEEWRAIKTTLDHTRHSKRVGQALRDAAEIGFNGLIAATSLSERQRLS